MGGVQNWRWCNVELTTHWPTGLDYPYLPEEPGPAASAMDPNRLPFSDFLRDVLRDDYPDPAHQGPAQGLTVLDFCDYGSLELSDDDFGLLDYWNADGAHAVAQGARLAAYGREPPADMALARQGLVNIWTNTSFSPPRSLESGQRERNATNTTGGSDSLSDGRGRLERIISEKLDRSARDRILAIVLNTSRHGVMTSRLASSFPSVEVMDMLIQSFMSSLASQASEWIHLATFGLNMQSPEWLAAAAAAGATTSPDPTMRKFGFILQDAARESPLPTLPLTARRRVLTYTDDHAGVTLPSQV